MVRYQLNSGVIQTDEQLAPRWLTGEVFGLDKLNNTLLVGGTNALVCSKQRLLPSMIGADRFSAIAVHGDSVIAGTNVGLFVIAADFTNWSLIEGTDGMEVSALAVDYVGQIWFGTLRDGLFRVRDGRVRREAKRELPDNRITCIALDQL